MMCRKTHYYQFWVLVIMVFHGQLLLAQDDSTKAVSLDSLLLNRKGIVGRLAKGLFTDTTEDLSKLQGNDKVFQRYRGRVIRNIIIKQVKFGVSIGDTNRVFNNWLTRVANALHNDTREEEIRQNLFFKQNDTLSPYLLGDNERYLRDLPYLQDARIKVRPVNGSKDSVDVTVLTKDLLSIGGSLEVHNTRSTSVALKEDNFGGLGDRLQLQMLFDQRRKQHLGYGFEYISRNIKGSFIDGSAGLLNYDHSFSSGKPEEKTAFISFIKPLVNPYMRWTYALDARWSGTQNMYSNDSFYTSNLRYKMNVIDAWGAYNTSAGHIAGKNEEDRLRMVLSARFLNQHFNERPVKYNDLYNYQFADLTAVLGAISFFRQNFYKTQYLYRFGRPEDVPQGIDATLTWGWTQKEDRRRPYMGVNYQRFFFRPSGNYFNYTFEAESYFHKRRIEDVNVLWRVSFISFLHDVNSRWKQRTFLAAEVAKQFNSLLNEPVYPFKLYGNYDLHDLNNTIVGGTFRANVNAESVFYSPWSIFYFRMAPFAFGDASLFRSSIDHADRLKLYTAIGGGIRFRNESLVFGTMDLKAWYFPEKNFNNQKLIVEFRTKVRFTYNQNFVRRPEFIQIN